MKNTFERNEKKKKNTIKVLIYKKKKINFIHTKIKRHFLLEIL